MEKKHILFLMLAALLPLLAFAQEPEAVELQDANQSASPKATVEQPAYLAPFAPIATGLEADRSRAVSLNKKAAPAKSPALAEATDTTVLWGHVITGTNLGSITRPSIVQFSTSPSTTYSFLWTNNVSNLLLSSTFCEDYIHFAEVYMSGQRCIEHKTSTKTWTEVSHTDRIYSCDIQSTCSAWDPQTRLVYGQFYANNYDSVEFATVDFEHLQRTGGRTAIRTVHTDGTDSIFVVLAFNDAGKLYAVTSGGSFMQVDKTTGLGTVVGSVGFKPTTNLQAMAYDKKNNRFLWNGIRRVQVTADSIASVSSLYSIDPATGHATKIYDMPGNAEFISLYVPYTPDTQAPDTVTALTTTFAPGSTTGTVSFTMPTTSVDSTALSGNLKWTLKSGATILATGEAAPGAAVSQQVTVERGYTTFHVTASNAAGESREVHTANVWIGFDVPNPVQSTSLAIDQTTGALTLSWKKPDVGIHGGYLGNMTYNLRAYPGGTEVNAVADTIYATTVSGDVLTAYYYDVTPVSEIGETGETTRTVRKWFGQYVEIPYLETFDDAASLDPWYITSYYVNRTWTWSTYMPSYMTSRAPHYDANSSGRNDAWLMSPYMKMKSDRKYIITFETTITVNPNSASIDHQHLYNLYFGKSRSKENTLLADSIWQTTVTNQQVNWRFVVAPDSDGLYSFAIRDITPKVTFSNSLYFDNFKVQTYGLYVGPDSCRNLTITPAERGELAATITFTTPTRTMAGDQLTSLTGAYVIRDDSVVVKHFDTATPGETLTAVDNTVPTDGNHTYTVYATNEAGDGVKFDSTAYIGVDIPLQPRPLKLINNGDGTGVFQWEEPSEVGTHGGYVNPADLTYNVYYLNGSYATLRQTGVTANYANVSISNTGSQARCYYLVSAVSRAGEGQLVISPYTLSGAPYETPYKESFSDATLSTTPWIANAYNNNAFTVISDQSYDSDNGAISFTNVSGGVGQCTLLSPKVSLDNCVQPSIKINYYARPKRNIKFSLGIEKPNQDIVYLDTIDFNSMSGQASWKEAKVSLNEFKNLPYIRVAIFVENKLVGTTFIVDNIRVENEFDNNLAINLHTPAITHRGKTIKARATVKNNGNNDISGYEVAVRANGTEFARQSLTTTLSPDSSAVIVFDYAIAPTAPDTIVFDADVSTTTDDYAADNTWSRTTVVKESEFVPTALAGAKYGSVVSLSWNEPANTDARVTEDWESTTPFTTTDFSPWDVYDGDGTQTYHPAYFSYPGMGKAIAFVCLDNSQIDGIDDYPQYSPFSGNQYLADFLNVGQTTPNNDWLISPLLSGKAQTVRVFVKQPEEDASLEEFEFRWSTTDNHHNSFNYRLNDTIYNAIPGMWGYLDADVPDGTKYFAVRVRSSASRHFMLMIDDITYTRGGLKPVAYNVYQDGRLIGTVSATDSVSGGYAYSVNENDPHSYNITVVYDEGESPMSNTYSTDPTGIATVRTGEDAWSATAYGGQLYIGGLQGQTVMVSDVGGAVYYRGAADGQLRLSVPHGVYIIRVGNTARKMAIK